MRPSGDVPPAILTLTQIDAQALKTAPTLDEVMPELLRLLDGRILVAHNATFDVSFLLAALDDTGYTLPCSEDALDTLLLARILWPELANHKLQSLIEQLQLAAGDAHRALEDALATAHLFLRMHEAATDLPVDTLQQLTRLAGGFSAQTATWFAEAAERRMTAFGTGLPPQTKQIRGLVFSWPDKDDEAVQEDAAHMLPVDDLAAISTQFLEADGPLQAKLPGFEVRPGQVQMVDAVARALSGDEHLLVEAGTGTGKSMAYLVPAALHALATDSRVVIATHTIALQDQIATRDFPMLRELIPAPLHLSVFKGRTHYVCMRKVLQETNHVGFGAGTDEVVAYMGLLVWLTRTPSGSREELALKGRAGAVWPRVQSETESCVNKRCPFFKPCYYFRARAEAQEADLIVTNHSLVFTDLKADHRVLPKYEKLVFDEAHHLEEGATKHLGDETQLQQCLALFGRLTRDRDRQGVLPELLSTLQAEAKSERSVEKISDLMASIGNLREAVERVFDALAALVPEHESEFRLTAALEGTSGWQSVLHALDLMSEQANVLSDGAELLESLAEQASDLDFANRLYDAAGFMPELHKNVSVLASAPDWNDESVIWVELRRGGSAGRRQIGLFRAPIDVAGLLQTRLFDTKMSVVMTSATLSVNHSFQFAKTALGLLPAEQDGRLQSLTVPSPFSYAKQALLCVPTDVPDLARMQAHEAAVWLSDSLYQLAKASDGRVLALFTSHAMLRATADGLRDALHDAGFELFAQGIDGGRTQLLEAFRQSPRSVLLGAQSFWEGIDLPGDELRTLVIIRLPFAPPTHPVTKARHERLEAQGKSAFWHASLPDAVVRFRQGFGRLIRTTSDHGIVVVYDKRIIQSKYGSTFIRSLPGVRPFVADEATVFAKVTDFLAADSPH